MTHPSTAETPTRPTTGRGFLARREHFESVGSTNDVVRAWFAEDTPEVCLAVTDEQTAGRGRAGRSWTAPPGRALLLSLGFRPTWLAPDRVWRLAAVASLAMAEAAEDVAGLDRGTIRLKWPNDLVVDGVRAGGVRKVAGVLGETDGLGGVDPRVVIGLGINVTWPADSFPPELAGSMTSLSEVTGGGAVDRWALLDVFLGALEGRIDGLRADRFDAAEWAERQLTSGRTVQLESVDHGIETVVAVGVDPLSGALRIAEPAGPAGERLVHSGEIHHVRVVV